VDPLELNRLVEKAKAEATATGAIEAPHKDILDTSEEEGFPKEALASKAEDLAKGLDKMAEDDEMVEALEKKSAAERKSHMYIAKLLTAIDIMSEVN
jgi:Fic family protein